MNLCWDWLCQWGNHHEYAERFEKAGKTVLIVHHDLSKVPHYFDQVLLVNREVIAFGPTKETFTEANLKEAYGNRLFFQWRWPMIAEFIDGLQKFHFLQNALITAIVVGVVAGAVGCFIILRGMSLMGDAISHAVLPGVAPLLHLGRWLLYRSHCLWIASCHHHYLHQGELDYQSDTAIGITFSSFLALGIILISVAKSSTDLFHILLVIS